jgi:dihydrodipicolinate reductase
MKIIVVGSGKLASAILTSEISSQAGEVIQWDSKALDSKEKVIVVHAGSGRQLKECFEYCSKTKSIFIELSTGLETEQMTPDFPLVICPNTSVLMLKTLSILKANGSHFADFQISLTESHQSTKKTEPGTAYAMAQWLKLPVDQIVSIRDPEIQHNKIGIPNAYLDKHAYHKIVITDGNDQITIETKVLGHDSYAKGVAKIIETVLHHPLENRRYSILDLIE